MTTGRQRMLTSMVRSIMPISSIAGIGIATIVLVGALGSACSSEDGPSHSGAGPGLTSESGGPPLIEVDGGSKVIYTWIEEGGGYKVARSRSEIPEDRRGVVRVQETGNPPSDPAKVWVADLRTPQGGRYAVQSMSRAEFEGLAAGQRPSSPPDPVPTPSDGSASEDSPQVVMYMTSTCPVCRRARSWLSKQGVSFVERNIQRDPNAARELQQKAQQQGVPADGVPIFEISGRLIPGFDQRALSQALGR